MFLGSSLKAICLSLLYLRVVFASSSCRENGATSTPVVNLGYAKYQGVFNETTGNTHFLGVRFAAPPTGTLRWQPPHTPTFTAGVQLADTQPQSCMSARFGTSPTTPFRSGPPLARRQAVLRPSEDCLFLNVYTPGNLKCSTEPLPVIIWIHGGGYMTGSASGYYGSDLYDGSDLIHAANKGVVTVVIQYRLGVFGFLAGSKVKAGGALNAGLLDQRFAFEWVKNHISKFRGDPKRVTIWGQSAGAGSVLQHVIAQDGRTKPPLFLNAISSSSFLPSQYRFDDPIPESLYSAVTGQTGCGTATDSLACLRSVDTATLQNANVNIGNTGFFGTFVFVPVVDGTYITQRPTAALRQGKVNGNALFAMTNTFEGAIFVDPNTTSTVEAANYISNLFPTLNVAQIRAAASLYAGDHAPIDQAIAVMTEAIFICPTYVFLRAFPGRAYKGAFAVAPAKHGDDMPFYFPSRAAGGGPAYKNSTFTASFPAGFLNFAMTGNPNIKKVASSTPNWSPWNGKNEMLFNKTDDSGLNAPPVIHSIDTSPGLLARCAFWESISAATAQ